MRACNCFISISKIKETFDLKSSPYIYIYIYIKLLLILVFILKVPLLYHGQLVVDRERERDTHTERERKKERGGVNSFIAFVFSTC